jgi:hypothetical protein
MSDFEAPNPRPAAAAGAVPPTVTWARPERQRAFEAWLAPLVEPLRLDPAGLTPASADASFRRYLRLPRHQAAPLIVMDAPPPLEDTRPFVRVAGLLAQAGLRVPAVHAADLEQGFLLLDDLGSTLLLPALQAAQASQDLARADRLMRPALAALVRLQQRVPAAELPPFDARAQQAELDLFPQWCVEREFGRRWGEREQAA